MRKAYLMALWLILAILLGVSIAFFSGPISNGTQVKVATVDVEKLSLFLAGASFLVGLINSFMAFWAYVEPTADEIVEHGLRSRSRTIRKRSLFALIALTVGCGLLAWYDVNTDGQISTAIDW